MKNLLSKIDKIGLFLCLLIFFHCAFEIYLLDRFSETGWSVKDIRWRFYIYIVCGLLLIFRANWSKFAVLLLSLSVFGSFFFEIRGLSHFFYQISLSSKINFIYQADSYSKAFLILLIIFAIYSFYSIVANLYIERQKKITLK